MMTDNDLKSFMNDFSGEIYLLIKEIAKEREICCEGEPN